MPDIGDTLRYSNAALDSLVNNGYQMTGSNMTWDFSNLIPISQELEEYENGFFTPYGFFFLGVNVLGVKQADSIGVGAFAPISDVYNYFQNTNNEYRIRGTGLTLQGIPFPTFYTDNDEVYQFPLDFGDEDSTTFRFEINLLTLGSISSTGYRINEVDGFGMITTPFGTFDAIRVKSTIVSQDSVNIGGFPIANETVTIEYKWLANGVEIPVLEIAGTEIAGVFAVTGAQYRDVFRNVTPPLAPVPDFEADNTNPPTDETVNFTNLTPLAALNSYVWEFSPNTVTYIGGTNANSQDPMVQFNQAGFYDVSLTAANLFGEGLETKVAYITAGSSSVQEPESLEQLILFPNPVVDSRLQLQLILSQQEQVRFRVVDPLGKVILEAVQDFGPGLQNHQLSLPGSLGTGQVYYLELRIGHNVKTLPFQIK